MSVNTPYKHLFDKARARVNEYVHPDVWLHINAIVNKRHRTVGGTCGFNVYTITSTIMLNGSLFDVINDSERYEIICHELAHAIIQVSNTKDNRKHHGSIWKSFYTKMGGTGNRSHIHTVPRNIIKRIVIKRKDDNSIFFVTSHEVKNILLKSNKFYEFEFIGNIQVNKNTKNYTWTEFYSEYHRDNYKNIELSIDCSPKYRRTMKKLLC